MGGLGTRCRSDMLAPEYGPVGHVIGWKRVLGIYTVQMERERERVIGVDYV
jgi:hypothetical protein